MTLKRENYHLANIHAKLKSLDEWLRNRLRYCICHDCPEGIVFRAKLMSLLRKEIKIPQSLAKKAFEKKWGVYAKRPFASPKTVVEYLGRYTHKVAIPNHRLTEVNDKAVRFNYKDYRDSSKQKSVALHGTEFLRRFSTHILPSGFVRIRHYGFLASKNKNSELNIAKAELKQPKWEKQKYSWIEICQQKLGYNPQACVHCGAGKVIIMRTVLPERGPPFRK